MQKSKVQVISKNKMQLGYIGLGRMGKNMVLRLVEEGIDVIAWNRSAEPRKEVAREGVVTAQTIDELISKLKPPRNIWVMVTAGEVVDKIINELGEKLDKEDLIIDGGNSLYKDTVKRGKELEEKGIHFMDVGTSGGVESARSGACLMVGGEKKDFEKVESVFEAAAAPKAYGLFGPVGSGHFAKMVHNGIEYGMMEAIGEGAALLKDSPFNLDLKEVFRVYGIQSIIESRLVSWAYSEIKNDPTLANISSTIGSGGIGTRIKAEGDWTLKFAKEKNIDIPVIEASIDVRSKSDQDKEDSPAGFRNKVVSAMRGQFGQHPVKKTDK